MTITATDIDIKIIEHEPNSQYLSSSPPGDHTPSEQEIASVVSDLWKEDPRSVLLSTAKLLTVIKVKYPTWILSINRLKTCLKAKGLTAATSLGQLPQYATNIKSSKLPDLDPAQVTTSKVSMIQTKAKGKRLQATKAINDDLAVIWEENPLVVTIPLEKLRIVRGSIACAYCGKAFQERGTVEEKRAKRDMANESDRSKNRGLPGTTSCLAKGCDARFCDNDCRQLADSVHGAMWHNSGHTKIKSSDWKDFEKFCVSHHWNVGYSYGVTLLTIIKSGKNDLIREKFEAMATIPENQRYSKEEIDDLHLDKTWDEGYRLLKKTVGKIYDLSFDEFLRGLGTFSLNNYNGNLYELQSHLNHSCEPNVRMAFSDGKDRLRVEKMPGVAINANDELEMSYINSDMDYEERQELLLKHYGFACNCTKCKREAKTFAVIEIDSETGYIKPPPTSERSRRKSVRFNDEPLISVGKSTIKVAVAVRAN